MRTETLPGGGQIPVLGLGTWRMGGGMSPDRSQDTAVLATLHAALDMGYRHIDTAEMYGDGHTESLIGRVIDDFPRDELFLTTKVWHTNLRPSDVSRALDGSLRRLGVDYVDLYLIHWPNDSVPLSETFRALNEAVSDGRVRRLGVSNFNLAQLEEARSLSETPIATNQVPYSVTERNPARNGVLDYCQAEGIVLTAYSPLKDGVLSQTAVREIAHKIGATPAQVALSWLLGQERVITIPKSMDEAHLRQNLAALDVALDPEDRARLDGLR